MACLVGEVSEKDGVVSVSNPRSRPAIEVGTEHLHAGVAKHFEPLELLERVDVACGCVRLHTQLDSLVRAHMP